MLDFIILGMVLTLIISLPYKKIYYWLSDFINVRIFSGAVLLISIRFIYGWIRPDFDELGIEPVGYTKALYSFVDVLGWVFMVAGVVLLFVAMWDAVETKKHKHKELAVNNKDDEG